MNGKTRKQLLTRLIIAACITLAALIFMMINFISEGIDVVQLLLIMLVGMPFVFFEIYGFVIEPKLYFTLLAKTFRNLLASLSFFGIFIGIFMIFIDCIIAMIQLIIIGVKALIFIIKNR